MKKSKLFPLHLSLEKQSSESQKTILLVAFLMKKQSNKENYGAKRVQDFKEQSDEKVLVRGIPLPW